MIDVVAPKAAGELLAQLSGPRPSSPSKPEKRDG